MEGRHRPQDRTQVSPAGQAPQRGQTHGQELAYPIRSLCRSLARHRTTATAPSRLGGQDHLYRPTTPFSGPFCPRPTADLAASLQAVASRGGLGQGGFLRSGPSPRSLMCQRLHPLYRPGRHHPRPALGPHYLPLRPDLLQLGDRHRLLFRKSGKPQRGLTERPVGTGRCAAVAPYRSTDGGHPTGCRRGQDVQAALPGSATALRFAGSGHPGGQRS